MAFSSEQLRNSTVTEGILSVDIAMRKFDNHLGIHSARQPQTPLTKGILQGFVDTGSVQLRNTGSNPASQYAVDTIATGLHAAAVSFDEYTLARGRTNSTFHEDMRATDRAIAIMCMLNTIGEYQAATLTGKEQSTIVDNYPVLSGMLNAFKDRYSRLPDSQATWLTDGVTIGLTAIGHYVEQ
jgi:hypothetical protein